MQVCMTDLMGTREVLFLVFFFFLLLPIFMFGMLLVGYYYYYYLTKQMYSVCSGQKTAHALRFCQVILTLVNVSV